jgi:hypothetical protein
VLAVIPAEREFPKLADAVDEALAKAQVTGVDEKTLLKEPIDGVLMQIECNERGATCYTALGKVVHADRLLFALIGAAPKKQIDVTVMLFDVAAGAEKKTAHTVYASEAAALGGIAKLVDEATRP